MNESSPDIQNQLAELKEILLLNGKHLENILAVTGRRTSRLETHVLLLWAVQAIWTFLLWTHLVK